MSIQDYKNYGIDSRAETSRLGRRGGLARRIKFFVILGLIFAEGSILSAQTNEEAVARSTLKEVESICNRTKTLDALGKETLSQSVTLMDLGEASIPSLLEIAKDRKKEWRFRYWAVDMLGYVPDSDQKIKVRAVLLRVIKDEDENKLIRLRAVDSFCAMGKENLSEKKLLKKLLRKNLKKVKETEVRSKMVKALKQL